MDLKYTCRECSQPGEERADAYGAMLRERKLCFDCNHFWQLFEKRDDPSVVRARGHHYMIGAKNDPFPGFGGQRFVIKFFDGRVVETKNLWHQGDIPERWRERMPDNAEFVNDPDMEGRRMR